MRSIKVLEWSETIKSFPNIERRKNQQNRDHVDEMIKTLKPRLILRVNGKVKFKY